MTSKSPRPAAFFDVDGTLASSNIVLVFLSLQRSRLKGFRWWLWALLLLLKAPFYGVQDIIDRKAFNRSFSRSYKGITMQEVKVWCNGPGKRFWERSLYPQAEAEVRRLKSEGFPVVILSGGLLPFLQPLADHLGVDALYASQPEVVDGVMTGKLIGRPVVDEEKGVAIRQAAQTLTIDLTRSYAYANSYGDRFFFEAAGYPVTVNPSRRLTKLAAQHGWPTLRWRR
ncbi:MAG: HAD-IB family hydrolase [Dehalococcoidia bacterium]|nr:HAD-IB family hydrolase [Dehalococcoidia bacterium]